MAVFDARPYVALQQRDEVISLDLTVTEDCGQKTGANGLTRMDRYYRSAAVRVPKEVMAPLDPGDIEAGLPQGSDHLSPSDAREASHVTVIF
jgi:hypothetical protein